MSITTNLTTFFIHSAKIGIQTKVETSTKIVKEGRNIILECPSITKPYCSKNGRGLRDHLFYEHSLIIEGALASDEGRYICNGEIDERRITICEITVFVAGK